MTQETHHSTTLWTRDFTAYVAGVVLSEIGNRATLAASLYQVYALTGSLSKTGLVGGAAALGTVLFSPLGGVYADRYERRRLLQVTQAVGLLATAVLTALTVTDNVTWPALVGVMVVLSAAGAFDQPARQALMPALVTREQLPRAVALINPCRELAVLVGPTLAGLLIAVGGPGLVYGFDVATFGATILLLAYGRTRSQGHGQRQPFVRQVAGGARFIAGRRIIWSLVALDLTATVLGAYRVVLPALAEDVLHVGPQGYGILAAAPSAGALMATYLLVKKVGLGTRVGLWSLWATLAYGVMVVVVGASALLPLSLLAAVVLGGCDAVATSVRHAVVQLETPDDLRGRVASLYQIASRGGPALGDLVVGVGAGLLGPTLVMTVGGGAVAVLAGGLLVVGGTVRSYRNPFG